MLKYLHYNNMVGNNMQSVKKFLPAIIAAVLFVAVFAVCTIYDFQISLFLADLEDGEYLSTNIFGRIFEVIGELPVYLFMAFAFAVLVRKFGNFKGSVLGKIVSIFCAIVAVVGYFLALNEGLSYIFEYAKIDALMEEVLYDEIGEVLVSALLYFITYKVINKFSSKTIDRLVAFAIIIIITAVVSQVITKIVKIFAGRARYRMMHLVTTLTGEDAFSYYTPWYVFNMGAKVPTEWRELGVPSNGFNSFPSGHTSAGATTVVLFALPLLFANVNTIKGKVICYGVGAGFPLIVAVSRVVMGAHFMTDVLAGFAITLVTYFIVVAIFKRTKIYKTLTES